MLRSGGSLAGGLQSETIRALNTENVRIQYWKVATLDSRPAGRLGFEHVGILGCENRYSLLKSENVGLKGRWDPRTWEFRTGRLPMLDSYTVDRLESPVSADWSP